MVFRVNLYGLEETITRPVIIQVLQDISREIGCLTNPYLYIDENSNLRKTKNRDKNSSQMKTTDPVVKFASKYKEFLKVTGFEESVETGYETDPNLLYPQTKPILIDPEIHYYLKPVIQRKKVELTVEYSTLDRVYLNGVINQLKTLPVYNEGQFLHHIEYSYSLPTIMKNLLAHIYTRKRKEWTDEELTQRG